MGRNRKRDQHNRGNRDGAKRRYNPPHSRIEDLVRHTISGESRGEREDRRSYDKGHRHGRRQKGGDCFLTTACVEHAGLPDNCTELQVLRSFRDNYITRLPGGSALIRTYYQTAPEIVRRMNQDPSRTNVLSSILKTVRTAVALIADGENEKALVAYGSMFNELRARFCHPSTLVSG
jgi:hypothetical protein